MATAHDNRRRPVRNALLKWQLQEDQKRIAATQRRLMRMAAPSLGLNSYDRRRPRPVQHDPEEDALMSLLMEREEREAGKTNHHMGHLQPSKLLYPSKLPPLRRPEGVKPKVNNSIKKVTLRATGQKLNAAGDFYSPVRPSESSLNNSSSGFRQNLAISRIKAPTPKRSVGATPASSPKTYDQMKTPDRWRTTAMQSNQEEEFNASALKRWEEEDALQADRLLEKAAKDGDNEALWNDFFYGTKAARAKSNQLPQQPIVYSTSSFPEVFSRSRSNSHGSSCYEDDRLHKTGDGMLPTGDENHDDCNGGDGDEVGEKSRGDVDVQSGRSRDVEIPRWSVIMVASCLVIGTSGFFMEDLMSVMGLFTRRTLFTLSKSEQERMRKRVSALQLELQGFQLSTSEIEMQSQTALTELCRHMGRMRRDREKHQDMLANEMLQLRRHVLQVTHELVEKERESIQTQLEEMVKAQVIIKEKADEEVDDTATEALLDVQSAASKDKSELESRSDPGHIEHHQKADKDQIKNLELPATELNHKDVIAPILQKEKVSNSSGETSNLLNNAQDRTDKKDSIPQQKSNVALSQSHNVETTIETVSQAHSEKVKVELDQVIATPVPVLERADVSTTPAANVKVVAQSRQNAMGMSLDEILLLVGLMFLAACVVLRVYNINRRKRWFEERRKRRNQRALRLAQLRARAMAESQNDSDEWDDEADGVEEISLMTPVRDEDEQEKPELEPQTSDIDTDVEDSNQTEQTANSTAEMYRVATTEFLSVQVAKSVGPSKHFKRQQDIHPAVKTVDLNA
ncbi:uncharacterized protein PITG_10981 [Phytophthora infestans T30-4]|uniref:Transmembrane protein n=1 Tax=Phytophthora infestans (strain T30-4) TaxID=403677 RepID=D0NFW2_PHYIT|nr:uncharacterized protein PITG_10981 [Phytophthora infestans T30-4]EEY57163.1 conserved hypothetical protein [Phytophthora infestans T30-4]|eukprot:XP_002901773.1 conserved hypothetical protein [Phytophthora infestans T30-4]